MHKGQQLLTMTPGGQDSNTEQDLRNLQEKWEAVQAKVAERKVGNREYYYYDDGVACGLHPPKWSEHIS